MSPYNHNFFLVKLPLTLVTCPFFFLLSFQFIASIHHMQGQEFRPNFFEFPHVHTSTHKHKLYLRFRVVYLNHLFIFLGTLSQLSQCWFLGI